MSVSFRLRVDPKIFEAYPGYAALAIYAWGIENGPSDDAGRALLDRIAEEARAAFGDDKPATHPHIAAWREAFGRFGAKPSKYPCSVESLLSRVLKGGDLPSINRVVDLYNAVSVRHVLPVGGEDLDALTSDLVLTFARGDEPFAEIAAGVEETTFPEPGEVVWADSSGVTCRRWNWRQCRRTRLTEDTRNAYFIFDSLPPYPADALQAAGDELVALLGEASPGCRIETDLLRG